METLTRIYEADLRTLEQHGDSLPKGIVEILRWTLQRRPTERPRSARELAQALDKFAVQESIEPAAANLVSWLAELGLFGSRSGVRAATPNPDDRNRLRALGSLDSSQEGLKRRPSLPPRIASQEGTQSNGTVYEVRLSNGEIVSPLGSYELLESYATRRVPVNALVVKNNGRPRPARQIACLSNIIAAEDWLEEVLQSRTAYHHALDRSRLPAFLFGLVNREETAVIVARDGSRLTAISWENGVPVHAVSSDRETLLGIHLVKAGSISERQLLRAVDSLAEADCGRLGDVLIEQRAVLPADLLRALAEQLKVRVLSLGTWESGEIWYVSGVSAPASGVRASESSLELLTAMIRNAFSGRELARILAILGDGPIAASPVAHVELNTLGLTQQEHTALRKVAGARSLGRFMTATMGKSALHPDDILRAVFIGLSVGLLVSPGWPWH
jgi:hypothetical protein